MTKQNAKVRSRMTRKYGEPVGPCVKACLAAMSIERTSYRYATSVTDVKRILRAQGVSVRQHGTWTGKTVSALAKALKSGELDSIWLIWVEGHVLLQGRTVKVDTDPRQIDRRKILGAWKLATMRAKLGTPPTRKVS